MESRNSGEISECLLNCILDIVENCRNCNTRKVIELKIIVFKIGVKKYFTKYPENDIEYPVSFRIDK